MSAFASTATAGKVNRAPEPEKDLISRILADNRRITWLRLLSIFSLVYFPAVYIRAAKKMFWMDELITLFIAKLPLHSIWTALTTSTPDLSPPMTDWLTWAAIRLFGESEVVVRLPEMLAFWLLELSVFVFVARRTSAFFGFFSLIFIASTTAGLYAFDARPYGILLGLCGIALLSWQSLDVPSSRLYRWIALAGLAVSLAAALLTHYFAFLLFVAIAAGEMVRVFERRRVDFGIWLAIALGAVPLLFLLPLVRAARSYRVPAWNTQTWASLPHFYVYLLGLGVLPVFLSCCAVRGIKPSRGPRNWEWVAAIALALGPVLGLITAKIMHSGLVPRYTVLTIVGFGILVGFLLHAASGMRKFQVISGALTLVLCCGAWIAPHGIQLLARQGETIGFSPFSPALPPGAPVNDLPVVVSDAQRFLQLAYYGQPQLRQRTVYLFDYSAANKQIQMDMGDQAMVAMQKWTSVWVEPYGAFLRTHPHFLLYGRKTMWEWQLAQLQEDGAKITRVGPDFYDVLRPPQFDRR